MFHERPRSRRQAAGLLVCFFLPSLGADVRNGCCANYQRLINVWESSQRPLSFVGRDVSRCGLAVDGSQRPRPGDLLFEPATDSVFRDRKFLNFYADLGAPAVLFAGADLEGMILASAVDGALSGHAVSVVFDAVTTNVPEISSGDARLAVSSIIGRFAAVKTTSQVIDELSDTQC